MSRRLRSSFLAAPLFLFLVVSALDAGRVAKAQQSSQQSPISLVEQQALAARAKGDRESALGILLEALKADPQEPRLLLDVGTVELEMGLNIDALKAFQRGLTLQTDNLQILYGLARAELAVQDMPAAERHMRQYLAQQPEDPTAHFGLGRIFQMQERVGEAKHEFQRSIELQPNQTESYYELGDMAVNDSDYDQGAALFQKVLAQDPHHGGALTGLGIAAYRKKSFDQAVEFLRAAIDSAPTYQPAHYYYGLALKRLGRQEESNRELQIALDLDNQAKALEKQRPKILESAPVAPPQKPR